MRAREQFYSGSELERVQAEIRRARRAEKVWTAAAVVVLIALVALVYWLVCYLKAGGTRQEAGVSELLPFAFSPLPIQGTAMAPVWQGSILGLVAFLIMFAGVLVVVRQWQEEEGRRQEAGGTRPELDLHDPFYGITDGLDGDEMHRILTSCAAEGREVKRLLVRMDAEDDARREQEIAHLARRMAVLVRCMESLCERLQPEITEPETTILTGRAKS
jgi:hypothetical protein